MRIVVPFVALGLTLLAVGEAAAAGVGTVIVNVPADSLVWFNGASTNSGGPRRVFYSRGLEEGRTYTFKVQAQLQRDGRTLNEAREIKLSAGATKQVAFEFATAEARGAARQAAGAVQQHVEPKAPALDLAGDDDALAPQGPSPSNEQMFALLLTSLARLQVDAPPPPPQDERAALPLRQAFFGRRSAHLLTDATGAAVYWWKGRLRITKLTYKNTQANYYIYADEFRGDYWAFPKRRFSCYGYPVWFAPQWPTNQRWHLFDYSTRLPR